MKLFIDFVINKTNIVKNILKNITELKTHSLNYDFINKKELINTNIKYKDN